MPARPKVPCSQHGCPTLIEVNTGGRCPVHTRQHDRRRGSSTERLYDYRWQQARLVWLAKHPLCVECDLNGRVTAATVVDHIEPHKGDPVLFWDQSNWRSSCKPHHDKKTATKDGGFGRGA